MYILSASIVLLNKDPAISTDLEGPTERLQVLELEGTSALLSPPLCPGRVPNNLVLFCKYVYTHDVLLLDFLRATYR